MRPSRRRPGPDPGFTLVELLIVMVLVAVIATLASVGLLRAKIAANEASAIASLRAIHSAQAAFRATCGRDAAWAASLPQLGAAGTISPDLAGAATVTKSGYAVTLTATAETPDTDACAAMPTARAWYAQAVPVTMNLTGGRGFATANGEDIWQDRAGGAPALPFAPSGSVSRIE